MAVKINAKVLGINKPVEVKGTTRNIQRTILLNKTLLASQVQAEEVNENDYNSVVAQLDGAFDLYETVNNYVIDILKLNEKQQDKLTNDLEQEEVMELVAQISGKLMGTDETEEANQAPLV